MSLALPEGFPLAAWARETRPTAIQQMLALSARPGILSLALGLPAPDLFPTERLAEAAARVLAGGPDALQYRPSLDALREQVVEIMARRGVRCAPEQVFLTSGAQQGISLLARLLVEPGATVMVEALTYSGFLQAVEPLRPRLQVVRTDAARGIDLDDVEARLRAGPRPALLYLIPAGHNPLGVSLAPDRRARLAALAREHRMPVLEDDAYGFLRYDGAEVPPLRALEEEWVLYAGSFSKILSPALRAGWVVVPPALAPLLAVAKEGADIDTATLGHGIAAEFCRAGHLPGHVDALRVGYRLRRDALVEALREHFPPGTRWRVPECGAFVWVELPRGTQARAVLEDAVEHENVAFLPGDAFAVPGGGADAGHCMRLNFSHAPPERLREGAARIGAALRRAV